MRIIVLFFLLIESIWAASYVDMLGRSIEVSKAQKMVFLGPGALRLGIYLGLGNRVSGIEEAEHSPTSAPPYRIFFGIEKAKTLPIVSTGGPGKMPNLEALIRNKPDVIFVSFIGADQIETITKKTGIPVVALSYGKSYGGTSNKNLEDIKRSLKLIGAITGVSKRADSLVAFIEAQESELSKIKLPNKSLYIGGVAYKGIQPITSTEANYPPFELLGLKNAVFEGKNVKGHQFIDFEALLTTNPDIIFTDMQSRQKIAQDYADQTPMYKVLRAYSQGKVKEVLGFNNYSTNVENLLLISWQIAAYLGHDVSLTQKAQTIYDAFYPNEGKALLLKLPYKLN